MVGIAVLGRRIAAETLVGLVVILMYRGGGPLRAALDAEVVVALGGERTAADLALKDALCKGYGCRDAILPAIFSRNFMVRGDIVICGVSVHVGCHGQANGCYSQYDGKTKVMCHAKLS